MTRRILLSVLAPAFGAASALANGQDDAPPEPASLFAQTFPKPTGKNGFEEIVRAGERLRSAKAPYPPANVFTLAKRRAYLSDPACRGALSLLRQGLIKPIAVPDPDPYNPNMFAPFALLRSLARLLAVEAYVHLADGHTGDAVSSVADTLKMVHAFKSSSVVAGLVAYAVEKIALAVLVKERNAWNVRDCGRVASLMRKYLAEPDPALAALDAESKISLRHIQMLRAKPEEFADLVEEHHATEKGEPDTPASLRAEAFAEVLRTDAAVRERILREMSNGITAYYERAKELVANPSGRWTLDESAGDQAKRHPQFELVRPVLYLDATQTTKSSTENRLMLQLVAVHATIRAYRWENDRLPKTLAELRLPPNLSTDPFTGAPLLYEPQTGSDIAYRLESAGALLPGADGKDARMPFVFPAPPVPRVPGAV